jgi:hypothetical protein
MTNGKVSESWLDRVLRENARRAANGLALTPEFGAVCIRFTDAVLCNEKYGFKRLDKVSKAEVCSRVYMYLCSKADKYDRTSCENPSNWVFTLAKNSMISAVADVMKSDRVSEIVSAVIGADHITSENFENRAPAFQRALSEKIDALPDFVLNNRTKETIFGQVWRESWFRRDGKTVLQRARRHNRLQALKVAGQVQFSDSERDELKKMIEDHRNGRTGRT